MPCQKKCIKSGIIYGFRFADKKQVEILRFYVSFVPLRGKGSRLKRFLKDLCDRANYADSTLLEDTGCMHSLMLDLLGFNWPRSFFTISSFTSISLINSSDTNPF